MSDLAALMNVSPGSAGWMMGENQAMDREKHQDKRRELEFLIQKMQQEHAQNAEMQPLKLEHQRLQNQGMPIAQQLQQAQAQKAQLDNQQTQALMPTEIESAQHTLRNKKDTDALKMQEMFGKYLLSTAGELETAPPMMRGNVFMRKIQEAGLPLEHPAVKQWMGFLKDTPPEQLPKRLTDMSTHMIKNSEGYIKEELKQTESTKRTQERTNASRDNTQAQIAARAAAAEAKASNTVQRVQGLGAAKKFEEAIVQAELALMDPDIDDRRRAQLETLKAQAMAAKSAFEKTRTQTQPDVSNRIPVQGEPTLKPTPKATAPLGTASNPIKLN